MRHIGTVVCGPVVQEVEGCGGEGEGEDRSQDCGAGRAEIRAGSDKMMNLII